MVLVLLVINVLQLGIKDEQLSVVSLQTAARLSISGYVLCRENDAKFQVFVHVSLPPVCSLGNFFHSSLTVIRRDERNLFSTLLVPKRLLGNREVMISFQLMVPQEIYLRNFSSIVAISEQVSLSIQK